MSNQIIKYMWTTRIVVRWIPIHLSSSLLLVLANLQLFHLPSIFTILCLSKLPVVIPIVLPYYSNYLYSTLNLSCIL
jgi:hypothetical protein